MSFRLIITLILLLTVGAVFSWVSGQLGSISIQIGDTTNTVSLAFGAAVILFITILCIVMLDILRFIVRTPARWREKAARKRELKGEEWLAQGFIALSADNPTALKIACKQATKLLPQSSPLLELLQAENMRFEGDIKQATLKFEALTAFDETKARAHRALMEIAQSQANKPKALAQAQKWHTQAPSSQKALLSIMHSARDDQAYHEAQQALERSFGSNAIDKKTYEKHKASLLAAHALTINETEPANAFELAKTALKLNPELAPAGLIVAKGYREQGDIKQGTKILERLWKVSPNEQIADLYVHMRDGDGSLDRLKRAQTLEKLVPENLESILALGKALLENGDFEKAKGYLISISTDTRAQYLLAKIAEYENIPAHEIAQKYKQISKTSLVNQKTSVTKIIKPLTFEKSSEATQTLQANSTLQTIENPQIQEIAQKAPKKKTNTLPKETIFTLSQAPDDPGVIKKDQNEENS